MVGTSRGGLGRQVVREVSTHRSVASVPRSWATDGFLRSVSRVRKQRISCRIVISHDDPERRDIYSTANRALGIGIG